MAKDRLFLSSIPRGRDLEPRERASVSQNSRGDILRRSLRDTRPGWLERPRTARARLTRPWSSLGNCQQHLLLGNRGKPVLSGRRAYMSLG